MRKTKLKGVISDIHVPFHDVAATAQAIEYLKDAGIDELTLLGDICDFMAVSRFSRSLERRAGLKYELDSTIEFLDVVRQTFKKIKINYVCGNHEERWEKYLMDKSPELIGLEGMTIQEKLRLKDFNIQWHETKYIDNDMVFYHGVGRSSGDAGGSVKLWLNHFMTSVIIGHVHKQAVLYKRTGTGRVLVGIENPTLSQLDPEYEPTGTSNWQQGGTVLLMDYANNVNIPYPFQICNGKLYASKF